MAAPSVGRPVLSAVAGVPALAPPADLSAHVSWKAYLLVLAAALLGALVQGSIGFGAAMVVVPVLALVVPEALPVTVLVWVLPLTVAMALRERQGVDWSGVGWMAIGRLPGSVVGALVVTVVAAPTLAVLAGMAVLGGVAASLYAAAIPLTRRTKTAAGFVSGVMGTATSIGGPPLALLYQHQGGVVLRSTLAAGFLVGAATSLTVLATVGVIEAWHLVFASALLPGLAGGLALSRPLIRFVDGGALRPAVLAFTAATAVAALVRGLVM